MTAQKKMFFGQYMAARLPLLSGDGIAKFWTGARTIGPLFLLR
jgi:hypothetical protein